MCLEASTKPHVHWKFEIFGTNIASTMACPNFKNGTKTGLRCLGVLGFEMQNLGVQIIAWYWIL